MNKYVALGLAAIISLVLLVSFFFNIENSANLDPHSTKAEFDFSQETKSTPNDLSSNFMNGFGNPDQSPTNDIDLLDQMITGFFYVIKSHGSLPLGENKEITTALMGKNTYKTIFLSPDSPWINENGELTDRWGTPIFFHAVRENSFGIRSAGEDKKLWTEDDIVNGENASML